MAARLALCWCSIVIELVLQSNRERREVVENANLGDTNAVTINLRQVSKTSYARINIQFTSLGNENIFESELTTPTVLSKLRSRSQGSSSSDSTKLVRGKVDRHHVCGAPQLGLPNSSGLNYLKRQLPRVFGFLKDHSLIASSPYRLHGYRQHARAVSHPRVRAGSIEPVNAIVVESELQAGSDGVFSMS